MFFMASSIVSPHEWQPLKSGQLTIVLAVFVDFDENWQMQLFHKFINQLLLLAANLKVFRNFEQLRHHYTIVKLIYQIC
jgi:hypothetical protein